MDPSSPSSNSEEDIFAETNEGVEDVDLNDKESSSATATAEVESEKLSTLDLDSSNTAASAPIAFKGKVAVSEPAGLKFEHVLQIKVVEPEKVGDGMSAYVAYRVSFTTSIPAFAKPEGSVRRRFSDFLGLYEKLSEKYSRDGRIIPPKPEKSLVGTTKIKMAKEGLESDDFVERRRAQLERFLNRIADHPVLRMDPDFREFIERDGDLPKSTGTRALSGAGVMRVFNSIGSSVAKMTYKMDESDQWFEDKNQEVHQLEDQLQKLHTSMDALVTHRREYSISCEQFAHSANLLASVEDNSNLSFAITKLAETEERIGHYQMSQADFDFYNQVELIRDHLGLLESIKSALHERVKAYKVWKDAEASLNKKREEKVRMELANRPDKVALAQVQVKELEGLVDRGQENFDTISATIRKEIERFDLRRSHELKAAVLGSLEHQLRVQEQIVEAWETFMPEAKRISVN